MAKREKTESPLFGGYQASTSKDPVRIDFRSASRGLLRSIVGLYLLGLVAILAVDSFHYLTGHKDISVFVIDVLLFHLAALLLGAGVYRFTTTGWRRTFATESALLSITDVSSDGVYSVATDSIITAWSSGAERIFGFTAAEAVGQSVAIILPDDFLERDIDILEPLLTEGLVTGHRTLGRRKGGEVFPSEVSASLLESPDGEPVAILFVTRDVTGQVALEEALSEARDELEIRVEERTAELKDANARLMREVAERQRAEVALKESEEHFRSLIENAQDVIIVVDHLGGVEYVSPSISRLLGYGPEELIGAPGLSFVHPSELESVSKMLADITSAEGKTVTAEMTLRHRDGSYVTLEGVGRGFLDALGNVRIVMNGRDITERKLAEERIRSLNRELERSVAELRDLNRELEAFSYSVSHDLRAPLRAIQGFSEMLVDNHGDSLDEGALRLTGVITRNARQMEELIGGLLALSRLGRSEMNMTEVDMRGLAAGVIDEARGPGGGRVATEVSELPPAPGDRTLLRQVFANLVSNAFKFCGGSESPLVEIGGYSSGDENVYFVRDNGVGFDMQYASRLFGVFQRLHPQEDFEGTGIGLATVQRIVSRHKGRVWAEGAVGAGATFYFSLPS